MNVVAEAKTRDWLREVGGKGFRRCGPSNERLASTLGIDPADSSRLATGSGERRNLIGEFFQVIWKLATGDRTSAYPLLTEADAVAEQGMMTGMDDGALIRRFHELVREETAHEGVANNALSEYLTGQTDDLRKLGQVHLDEGARERELAAVCHEMDRRGLDPRTPS